MIQPVTMNSNESDLQPLTVFVIDDDDAARESVAAVAVSHGVPAETFASATDVLRRFDELPAPGGCLVIDYRLMDDMNGLELQQAFRNRGIMLPVIIVTAHATVPVAVQALQNGAHTLLEKPCRPDQLWHTICQALDEFRQQSARDRRVAAIRANYAELNDGERDVLRGMVAGKLNKVIARELKLSVRTVETRRHNIHAKMNADSLAELVRMVVEAQLFDDEMPLE